MATLRALVGGGSMLAFLGFVMLIPLGWVFVLYTAENFSAKQFKARHGMGGTYTVEITKNRPKQPKPELGQKKIVPRVAYERSTSQRMMK